MLRIVWFSIFFNYIGEDNHESEEEEGKLLMLRIVWFSML